MPKIITPFDDLVADWRKVYDSGFYSEGAAVKALEAEVERQTGMYTVAVNSAGTGLYAMLRVLCEIADLKHGTIAVPNNSFFATQSSAVEVFGQERVKLVDCERGTFGMSYDALVKLASVKKVKVVVLTHVGGVMARDYLKIAGWCAQHGAYLIEDAAHAYGCPDHNPAGSQGTAAVFSLYPTKAIPAGEGGLIVTRDKNYAEFLRIFRNYGKFKHPAGGIAYTGTGFNFRMDEWQGVVALHQVRRVKEIVGLRHQAAAKLSRVIPSLFDGLPSNVYKYPVAATHKVAENRQTGKVYAFGDQGAQTIRWQQQPAVMVNSEWVANNHICLPVEEGLYEGKSVDEITAWLRGEL